MKTNSCYSLFIVLLAISSLQGMEGPKKAITKKSTKQNKEKPELTPANLAAYIKDLSIEKFSVKELKNLVASDKDILHKALAKNNEDLAKALLRHNLADLNTTLKDGSTVLHTAAKAGCSTELLNTLLSKAQESLSQTNDDKLLPIDYAIKNMDLDIVKIFLEHNSPLSNSLIADAVLEADDDNENHLEIITLLCKKDSSLIDRLLNSEEYFQETALEAAIQDNKIKIVESLLKNGANPNGPMHVDNPPLFCAVQYSLESIPLLRHYGAEVHKKAFTKKKFDDVTLKAGMTPAEFAQEIHRVNLKDEHWLKTALNYLDPERTSTKHSEKMETD